MAMRWQKGNEMGLFDIFKNKKAPKSQTIVEMRFQETAPQQKASPTKKRATKRVVESFTTTLVGSTAKRQAVLATIGEGERLTLQQKFTSSGNYLWYAGYKGKEIGTVPDGIKDKLEKKYPHFFGKITNYKIIKDRNGNYQCQVSVDVIVNEKY